jgi:hypothetical protein
MPFVVVHFFINLLLLVSSQVLVYTTYRSVLGLDALTTLLAQPHGLMLRAKDCSAG